MSDSLRPCGLWTLQPLNSPGQNTGAGCLSLLQGIFPTQESNPGLPNCRQLLYQLSHQGSPNKYYIHRPAPSCFTAFALTLACSFWALSVTLYFILQSQLKCHLLLDAFFECAIYRNPSKLSPHHCILRSPAKIICNYFIYMSSLSHWNVRSLRTGT